MPGQAPRSFASLAGCFISRISLEAFNMDDSLEIVTIYTAMSDDEAEQIRTPSGPGQIR
ncbi:hypothetical protein ACWGI8_27895 [Streptomyces sp. NPDC054841]